MDLNNKDILITGGAGFIGSNIATTIQARYKDARVSILDSFRTESASSLGHFRNLLDFRGEIYAMDILDTAALDSLPRFDAVVHLAAISDTTVMDQQRVLAANYSAFKHIYHLCKNWGAPLVYASSAGTYGNTAAPNVVGKDERPENVYGFSKLQMDRLLWRELYEFRDLGVIGLRYFNVYGAHEEYKKTTSSMILQWGLQALDHGSIRIFKDGEQRRDFVYIDDVVDASLLALKAALESPSLATGVYNVGYGRSASYNDIVRELKAGLGDFKVDYIDNPYKFFQNHTEADITATREVLGYEPAFNLTRGVAAYIPYIKEVFAQGHGKDTYLDYMRQEYAR